MSNLRCLWLGNNKLQTLPQRFGYLNLTDWDNFGRHMFSTIIDGNPLTDPPMEICKQGIRAIAQYFGGSNVNHHTEARYDVTDGGSAHSSRSAGGRYDRGGDDDRRGNNVERLAPTAQRHHYSGGGGGANVHGHVQQSSNNSQQGSRSNQTTFARGNDRGYFPVGASEPVTRIGYQHHQQQQQQQQQRQGRNSGAVGLSAVPPRRSYNNTPQPKYR